MFTSTGCYSTELPNGIVVLSINSMQFSVNNPETNDPAAPKKIFDWLEKKFIDIQERKQRAILTFHIPLGSFITPSGVKNFWRTNHENTMMPLLKKYESIISGIYTGHIHISGLEVKEYHSFENLIQAEMDNTEATNYYAGQIINRAVSANLANNPGFTSYYYTETLNYSSYYEEHTFLLMNSYNKTDPASKFWIYLYNSQKDLEIKNLSPQGIHDFLVEVGKDLKKFLKYIVYRLGQVPVSAKYIEKVAKLWCQKKAQDAENYIRCFDSANLKDITN